MASSKQTRLVGLCRQCESSMFGTFEKDFLMLPEERRSVYCYSCGPIEVNPFGECAVKCAHGHNWTRWDRLKALLFNITP